jgi:hypothetical protein
MGADGSSTARSFFTRPPTGMPGRAINPGEGLLRPRVARAQKITGLHPFLRSKYLLRGVAKAALYCTHRTSTFLSCAFCEHEGHLATPFPVSFSAPVQAGTCWRACWRRGQDNTAAGRSG